MKLQTANQKWSDWKFNIYSNELEWVDQKLKLKKNHFMCLIKLYI